MPLGDCQVSVRELVMGPGTPYRVLSDFNPFNRAVRADQSGARAWNHGSWSGAEFAHETVVTLPVLVQDMVSLTKSGWLAAHQQLAAAFAPVADAATDVELRFTIGADEYVMFGRPRMVEPRTYSTKLGHAFTQCAFVALDPLIYSGELHTTGAIILPVYVGGMSSPLLVSFLIETTRFGGGATLVNAGTAPTGLRLRLDGPLSEPSVSLQRPDGVVQTLRFLLELAAGQWLDVDTAARTVFLNGLPQASRRGQTVVENGWPLLPPGTSEIRFGAADGSGTLTVEHRDAWF